MVSEVRIDQPLVKLFPPGFLVPVPVDVICFVEMKPFLLVVVWSFCLVCLSFGLVK